MKKLLLILSAFLRPQRKETKQICRGCLAEYDYINLERAEKAFDLWNKGIHDWGYCRRCGHKKPNGMDYS